MVQFFDQPLAVRISSVGFVSFPDRDLDRLEIGGTLSWGPPFDVTYNQAGAARAAYHLLEWVRICRDSSCISGRFGFAAKHAAGLLGGRGFCNADWVGSISLHWVCLEVHHSAVFSRESAALTGLRGVHGNHRGWWRKICNPLRRHASRRWSFQPGAKLFDVEAPANPNLP